jgi:hypothetical protein
MPAPSDAPEVGLKLLTVWKDPSQLHCIQLTQGHLERGHDHLPGAPAKGTPWRELRETLKAEGWHAVFYAPGCEPTGPQPITPDLKPFDLGDVGRFPTPHPWIIDACWAPWPPTYPVFMTDDGKRSFIRVRFPDGRATCWANVVWHPWSAGLGTLHAMGFPYRNSPDEMPDWWVRTTALPWRLLAAPCTTHEDGLHYPESISQRGDGSDLTMRCLCGHEEPFPRRWRDMPERWRGDVALLLKAAEYLEANAMEGGTAERGGA